MKRVLSFLLIATIAISMLVVMPTTVVAAPLGTAISTDVEFAAMAAGGQYYLTADITVSATYTTEFSGTFDGNGYKITISKPLFATVSGTVKNLTVEGSVDFSTTPDNAGAVTKIANNATFANVTNRASVTGYTTTYNNGESVSMATAGGIAGIATGNCSFTNIANEGAINGYNTGGIVGMVASSETGVTNFSYCTNSGAITAVDVLTQGTSTDPLYFGLRGNLLAYGGIVGLIYEYGEVNFSYCSNSGNMDNTALTNNGGSPFAPMGGIYGVATQRTGATEPSMTVSLDNCSNTASIKGKRQTGGLVGWAGYITFYASNCTNSGAIESTTNYSAGLFGRAAETSYSIINCVNQATGTVISTVDQVGGIIGYSYPAISAEIIGCVNYANISSTVTDIKLGGIVGSSGSTTTERFIIANCRNEGNLSGNIYTAGIIANCGVRAHVYIIDCVNTGDISGASYAAGIVGTRNANQNYTISGCVNEGNVEASANAVGGIVAYITQKGGLVSNCTNKGNITGTAQIGGIVGYSQHILNIDYCLNDEGTTISSNLTIGTGYAGGIVSRIGSDTLAYESLSITNCINKGTVYSAVDNAGGIVAYSRKAIYFENCYNYGNVTAPARAGGIAAYVRDYHASFKNCVNYGDVTGSGNIAAGILANSGSGATFSHTYTFESCGNEGNVTGSSYSAAIAGYLYGTTNRSASFEYCYNVGTVTSTANYVAGLLGYMNGVPDFKVANNYISGTFTAAEGKSTYATVYNQSATVVAEPNFANNYCKEGVTDYLRFKNDAGVGNIAFPEDYQYYIDNTDLSSGSLANTINTTAGKDVFYQTLGTDTYPTTNNARKAVRFNGTSYYNLLKATFVDRNFVTYVDAASGESFTAPTGEKVLYWASGSDKAIPNVACQITADKTFEAKKVTVNTQDAASVRMTEGSTGLRFYTNIDKSDYDTAIADLTGSTYSISYGTIVAPRAYVNEATAFTKEALGTLVKTSETYLQIPSAGAFATTDDSYIITGSITNLGAVSGKNDHRAVDFAAIGYICITDSASGNSYYLYSNTYSTRNVSNVATSALNDVADTQIAGYGHMVVGGNHDAKYSPYTAQQRAILESLVVFG